MFYRGVPVLVFDSHPDHNKGPNLRTMRMSQDPSPIYVLTTLLNIQPTLRLHDPCLEVLPVHGNELHLCLGPYLIL